MREALVAQIHQLEYHYSHNKAPLSTPLVFRRRGVYHCVFLEVM
jgi:hypothetical protein